MLNHREISKGLVLYINDERLHLRDNGTQIEDTTTDKLFVSFAQWLEECFNISLEAYNETLKLYNIIENEVRKV
jgi:hypothetical protein